MRILAVLLAFVALAQTKDDIDWSAVKPAYLRLPLPKGVEIPEMPELDNNSNENIIAPLIVGGNEATPNSIPYEAALLITIQDELYFCGGSLLSPRYILTAAHCIEGASQVEVRLGAHLFDTPENTQVRLFTSSFIQHPKWIPLNENTTFFDVHNDIAIIELSVSILSNANIQYVDLPSYSDAKRTFLGSLARISGWGRDSDTDPSTEPVLREVYVHVIPNFICNIIFSGAIANTQICTSGLGGRGACNGDSGSPLVVGNKQIGIVSFGGPLCEMRWPSVFTRVTSHLDWIAANTDVTILP